MEYVSKKRKKILNRIKRHNEGDENKNPYSTADERLGRRLEILSRGKKIERSHKMRVGKKVNKDLDKRFAFYKVLDDTMKRIENVYLGKRK